MNSIEKFVDRLLHAAPQKGAEVDTSGARVSTAVPVPPVAKAGVEAEMAVVDLERLATAGMITPANTRSLIAEEYRAIKRPLLKNILNPQANAHSHPNLIMITSALPGEGKSFTSVNLAVSIAMEMDHTVLLVEADVPKPALAGYLGLAREEAGLVDYLADERIELETLLFRTNIPKLTLLRSGRQHPQATELLASQNMRRLTLELAQRYPNRVVIFDAPPMLVSSEAVALAALVGQVVMVVESGKTPQRVVKDALALIGTDKFIGVVLNKSHGGASQGYGYGHYGTYGYGRE